MSWIPKALGGGVVTTRTENMLREDELVESSFCRLRPGNRIELFEDYGYEELYARLQMRKMLRGEYVSFDNIDTPYFLRVYVRTDGNTTILVTPVDQDGQVGASVVLPDEATEATVTARGAEYFVGTDVGNYVVSAPDGTVEIREMGLNAPTEALEATWPGVDRLGTLPFPQFGITVDWPESPSTVGPSFTDVQDIAQLLYNSLSNEPGLRLRNFRRMLATLPGLGYADFEFFYPVREMRLSSVSSLLGAYWYTNYKDELALESAPSEIVSALLLDPTTLVLEVKFDIAYPLSFPDQITSYYETLGADDPSGWFNALRVWTLENGNELWIQVDVPPVVEERLRNYALTVPETGYKRRVYRGAVAALEDFSWTWDRDLSGNELIEDCVRGFTPEFVDRQIGQFNRGERVVQGGLLDTLDVDETDYTDDRRATGTSDPTPAYPTVSYYTQGALGVYQYLQKPPPFVASANFGENLLLVPADNRQVIRVTPSGDPENTPPIYTLPIVSEDQDRIVAVQTLRDVAVVLTRSACLRLNYIPFESGVAQDRTLTQISDFHGAVSQKCVTTVETPEGQYVVWLSRTGLQGTNGFGFRDFCPDFSVEAAGLDPSDAERWVLVNNYREYRLELWTGERRWDFYYHPTLLKDVRGDGVGLSFRLMGPSPYWELGDTVTAADMGDWAGEPIMLLSVTDDVGSRVMLGREVVTDRTASVKTGQTWGSNPETLLTCQGLGLQHERRAYDVLIAVVNAGQVDTGASNFSAGALKQVSSKGFSYRVPDDGSGESLQYTVIWKGGAAGPLWHKLKESGSGFGA